MNWLTDTLKLLGVIFGLLTAISLISAAGRWLKRKMDLITDLENGKP